MTQSSVFSVGTAAAQNSKRHVSKRSVDNLISATSRFHKGDNLHRRKHCCTPLSLREYSRLLNRCVASNSEKSSHAKRNTLPRSLQTGKLASATLCTCKGSTQASAAPARAVREEHTNTAFHPNENGILKALNHKSSRSKFAREKK